MTSSPGPGPLDGHSYYDYEQTEAVHGKYGGFEVKPNACRCPRCSSRWQHPSTPESIETMRANGDNDHFPGTSLQLLAFWSWDTQRTRGVHRLSSAFGWESHSSTGDGLTQLHLSNALDSSDHSDDYSSPISSCTNTKPGSIRGVEGFDASSSCYSRSSSASSVDSLYNSEHWNLPSARKYYPPEAYFIKSPADAGVFDDTSLTLTTGIKSTRNTFPLSAIEVEARTMELDENPLPLTPSIRISPLKTRRSTSVSCQRVNRRRSLSNRYPTATSKLRWERQPSLGQAAEELEKTLTRLTSHTLDDEEFTKTLSEPLQIRRSSMRRTPTRPAPGPRSRGSNARPLRRVSVSHAYTANERHRGSEACLVLANSHIEIKGKNRFRLTLGLPKLRRKWQSDVLTAKQHLQTGLAKSGVNRRLIHLSGKPVARNASVFRRELLLKAARRKAPRAEHGNVYQPSSQLKNEETSPIDNTSLNKIDGRLHSPVGCVLSEEKTISTSEVTGQVDEENEAPPLQHPLDSHVRQDVSCSNPDSVHELDAGYSVPSPQSTRKSPSPPSLVKHHLPDNIVLLIMEQIDSLDDLFNIALLSRSFFRVLKQHELRLLKNTVFAMSPAAWELREMSPPWTNISQTLIEPDAPVPEYRPATYLKRYAQDMYTLAELKGQIIASCTSLLRPTTVSGLAGADSELAAVFDDAFWRIWTFCRVFGCGKNREDDIVRQIDWFKGGCLASEWRDTSSKSVSALFAMEDGLFEPPASFGRGNQNGLALAQLQDMAEIWTCLGVLLQPLHGKCAEARKVGIYDGHDALPGDIAKEEAVLEEWTSYVLSVGPLAVFALSSECIINGPEAAFAKAKEIGLTCWELPESNISRAVFLKAALYRAYHPSGVHRLPSSQPQASETITRRSSPDAHSERSTSPPTVRNRLAGIIPDSYNSSTQSSDTTTGSNQPIHCPISLSILDPTDQAINTLANDHGFGIEGAKWALKITDTGEGVDMDAALLLLVREREKLNVKRHQNRHQGQNQGQSDQRYKSMRESLLASAKIKSERFGSSGWTWA